ncbi:ABC transporter ATP-binding protein [Nocardioides caldifontis]|uniref:ABC transporter ATP-binding protein n=1 Tax=Nocardioides caldifontis TaxID=2588938 RepID=UPI0011E04BC0|nr:ABC transporter ATP-binding protein [Nocardioides caldifontis]
MTDLVIETHGLRKEHRRLRGGPLVAVAGLDLAVARGEVHGLLGPDGAGKTTAIRMLLGLARPTSGTAALFGEPVPRRLPRVVGRVGGLVYHPAFHRGLTARQNLLLLGRAAGVRRSRVDQVLEQVGLQGHGEERVRGYSVAMRQRLGLAAALLKEPELVVLDQPTAGLDPSGIREVRGLVRDLGRAGVTVLLSTHLLAEVQQVCDSVTIMSGGEVRRSGEVAGLVGRYQPAGVRVAVAELDKAAELLRAAGLEVTRESRTHLFVAGPPDPSVVTRVLAEHGHFVRELIPERPDVEDVVRRLSTAEAPEGVR